MVERNKHQFGDLLTQIRSRKHGVSQNKIAQLAYLDPSILSDMCRGKRLSGPTLRGRVIAIIEALSECEVLYNIDEANALLEAVKLSPLNPHIHQEYKLARLISEAPSPAPFVLQTPSQEQRGQFIPNRRCRQVLGREEFVNQVLAHLIDADEAPILALTGGPGYGKTEAVRQIALEAIAKEYFDDVIWVSAKSYDFMIGTTVDTTKSEILSAEKFWDQVAYQLSCPVRQLQIELRQHRFLIVLDNAETSDAQDILSGLNAGLGTSRAILTSRVKHSAPFIRLVTVRGLNDYWSEQLLLREAKYHNASALLKASKEELNDIHMLSDGAPLALHFIVGRTFHDGALSPVLAELKRADKNVAEFYGYCLAWAWGRINEACRIALRYMAHLASTSISLEELKESQLGSENDLMITLSTLQQWYLIQTSENGSNSRYDLHPWIRSSIKGNLVDDWQPSSQDIEAVAQRKLSQIKKWKDSQK